MLNASTLSWRALHCHDFQGKFWTICWNEPRQRKQDVLFECLLRRRQRTNPLIKALSWSQSVGWTIELIFFFLHLKKFPSRRKQELFSSPCDRKRRFVPKFSKVSKKRLGTRAYFSIKHELGWTIDGRTWPGSKGSWPWCHQCIALPG